MTVVLSVLCADGLVIASDTQVTDSDRGMSFPAQKLHDPGDHAVWGGSGARGLLADVERAFDEHAEEILAAGEIGRALQRAVIPIQRHHDEHFIPDVPGERTEGTPSAYLLAAGYSGGEPFIVEINPNGMVSRYEEVGFHAIGGVAPMAEQAGALLAHFRVVDRSVAYGVPVAVRVVAALSITSPKVGPEIDVARITPEGAHRLDDDELEQARSGVRRSFAEEQRVLDRLLD